MEKIDLKNYRINASALTYIIPPLGNPHQIDENELRYLYNKCLDIVFSIIDENMTIAQNIAVNTLIEAGVLIKI